MACTLMIETDDNHFGRINDSHDDSDYDDDMIVAWVSSLTLTHSLCGHGLDLQLSFFLLSFGDERDGRIFKIDLM